MKRLVMKKKEEKQSDIVRKGKKYIEGNRELKKIIKEKEKNRRVE